MFWKTKTILSKEEIEIKDILQLMLDSEETLIEVNPEDMSYLLSDERFGFFMEIDNVGIKLTNHDFKLDMRMSSDVLDVFKGMTKSETTKRRTEKKEKIFQNGIDLLIKIKTSLQNGNT